MSETEHVVGRTRPVFLWVFALGTLWMAGAQLFNHTLMLVYFDRLPKEILVQVEGWSVFDWALPFVLSALGIGASLMLFARKKIAVTLYALNLGGAVLATLYHAIATDWLHHHGLQGLASAMVGWGIWAGVWWYTAMLGRKGVLV